MAEKGSEQRRPQRTWTGRLAFLQCLLVLQLVSCMPGARSQAQQQAQQQSVLQGADPGLQPGNATCTTSYNSTTDCALSGPQAALAPFTALLTTGQRVRLLGQGPNGAAPASIALSANNAVLLDPGVRLELWNMFVGPTSLSAMQVDPLTSLAIEGIKLGSCSNNCTGGGAQLGIYNSTLLLECSAWTQLQQALCMGGRAPGDVEVFMDAIYVLVFEVGGVRWQDVLVLPACRMPSAPVNSTAICAVRTETQGSKMMDDIALLQAQAFPNIIIVLASTLVISRANVTAITSNVTIRGNANKLDVNLQPLVFVISDTGSLTLENVTLLNMLPSSDNYPLGLLSCLLWFVSVSRSQAARQLLVVNSTILIPPSEFDYLRLVINPTTGLAPWTAGSSGLFLSTPSGYAAGGWLVFDEADVVQGTWSNVTLKVLDADREVQAKLVWTGLDALLFPNEPGSNLMLPLVQSLSTNLSLATLGSSATQVVDTNNSVPVRMVMTQSVSIDRDVAAGLSQPVRVTNNTIIVGNTLRPDGAIFDLAGLTCIPGSVGSGVSPQGYLSIGCDSRLPATLYLRDMVLVNLQPAVGCAVDPAQDATGFFTAMSNYTSLLWMFNVRREPSTADVQPQPQTQPQLVLQNVTLVIPASEFRVLFQILISSLRFSIDPLAYQLLRQELGNMEIAAERVGSNIKYERTVGGSLTGPPPSPDALGTITFPVFNWFGITGKQVTFTSAKPSAMFGQLLPVDAALFPGPSPPTPPALPPAPVPPLSPGPGAGSAGAFLHSTWQLGLLVSCSILAAGLLSVIGVWMLRKLRRDSASACFMGAPASETRAVGKAEGGADMEQGGSSAMAGTLELSTCRDAGYGAAHRVLPVHMQSEESSAALEEHGDPQSSSSASNRGSPMTEIATAAGLQRPAVVAQSPFEAVALGLVSMAASGQEGTSGPNGKGSGGSSSRAPDSRQAEGAGGTGRLDTEVLLERIFTSVGVDNGALAGAGPGPGSQQGRYSPGSEPCSAAGRLWPAPRSGQQLSTPTGSMRHEIQRQMEVLKEELGGGKQDVPQWDVQCQLGKGAHGVVYKGTWRGLDVAIKRVIFQVLGDPVADARRKTALREAAINGTLHHPNIVTTYTHDMQPLSQGAMGGSTVCMAPFADWQLFIIQEYCDGGTLHAAIQEQRFWDKAAGKPLLPQILALATDIAEGCAYIHSKQIIHGDLKPDNVLLKLRPGVAPAGGGSATDSGRSSQGGGSDLCRTSSTALTPMFTAKVADFGMSIRISENKTHVSGVHQGTPLYISPEILQDGRASWASDVYSFGVIMWELFHGMSAWNHLVRMVGTPQKRSFPAFHPGMFNFDSCSLTPYAKLGQACLSINPADRPSFAQVLEALQSMVADVGRSQDQGCATSTATTRDGSMPDVASNSAEPCTTGCGSDALGAQQCHVAGLEESHALANAGAFDQRPSQVHKEGSAGGHGDA